MNHLSSAALAMAIIGLAVVVDFADKMIKPNRLRPKGYVGRHWR